MKVTFNNGYYIVKTETRESSYRAEHLAVLRHDYKVKIEAAQRALDDLEAIGQFREGLLRWRK